MCIPEKLSQSLQQTVSGHKSLANLWSKSPIRSSYIAFPNLRGLRTRHLRLNRVQLFALVSLLCLSGQQVANGQSIVVEPNSTNTQVDYSNNEYDIQGGALSEDGSNLFHSFNEFNLNTGETANFIDEVDTQNILGSVTGGRASFIDGLLQVVGSDANLYLLNPAGIFFGANARLNLLGSFTATTATHVEFGDHWLSVLGVNDYQTLVETPTAFAFGTSSPASVINTGDLGLRPGQTLRLLGGSVVNTGSLSSADGVIEIMAVPGESTVRITQEGFLLSLDLPKVSSDNPELMAPSGLTELPVFLTGGGDDHATQIVLANDGSVSLQSADDVSGNLADLDGQDRTVISGELDVSGEYGGSIDILGGAIQLFDAEISANGFQGAGSIRIGGDYRGLGNLPLASQLWVDSGTSINANAINNGNGGSVVLWADNQTQFFGSVAARGGELAGNGGFTEISGRDTLTFQGEVDLSAANGSLGTLLLDPENIIISGNIGTGSADGQLPEIASSTLLGETATLSQEALENIAETADVVLEATNDIRIEALDNDELDLGNGTERVGTVTFIADADQNGQGAFVSDTQSTILTNTRDINISGATIAVGNIRTGLQQSGRGGDISLTAVGDVTAGFFDTGEGDAGDIRIVSDQGDITVDRFVSTSSGPGDGGTIDLVSGGDILLREGIFSLSRQDGRGGPINLTGTGANSRIEILGNVEFGSEDGLPSGALTINTTGDVILEGELINRGGADIFVGDEVAPQTLSLLDNVISNGDDVFLRAGEILTTEDINTSSNTIGGAIDIASEFGDVNLGNLATNGVESGGAVTLFSGGALSTGLIDTSAMPGDGGDVELGARQDIEVGAINSQGGIDGGGVTVNIDTDRFLRVTESFIDQNGIDASISAAGGAGNGAIDIEHGGLGITPFIIGDASINGTTGAITAGSDNTLFPVQIITGSFSTGSISIRTAVSSVVLSESLENIPEAPNVEQPEQLADGLLPLSNREQWRQIEERTGIKPVIVYLSFAGELRGTPSLTTTVITSEGVKCDDANVNMKCHNDIHHASRHEVSHISEKLLNSLKWNINDPNLQTNLEMLHGYIINPIEDELRELSFNEKELSLIFAVRDIELSSIPFAALHNGEQYLVQNYIIGLKPWLGVTDYSAISSRELDLALMANGNLRYAETFLCEVQKIWGFPNTRVWFSQRRDDRASGTELGSYNSYEDCVKEYAANHANFEMQEDIDEFNIDALCSLKSKPHGMVHIKSHAKINLAIDELQPNTDRSIDGETVNPCSKDFIPEENCEASSGYIELSGSECLTFDQFKELPLSTIELLVLDACETIGDGSSFGKDIWGYDSNIPNLGFAELAYSLGVKSVMGTLWQVNEGGYDPSSGEFDGTFRLMQLFYRNLHQGMLKAEALQKAQIDLIETDNTYNHPYHWAGFTIVGSPW